MPSSIRVGAPVKVRDGTFAGFEGTVRAVDTPRRLASIAVSVFGREIVVEASWDDRGYRNPLPDDKIAALQSRLSSPSTRAAELEDALRRTTDPGHRQLIKRAIDQIKP